MKQEVVDSQGSGNNIKQERAPSHKRTQTHHTSAFSKKVKTEASAASNLDQEFDHAAANARNQGIVELKPNQVRRVVEGGKLAGLFGINGSLSNNCFVVYDGTDVLARVLDSKMEHLIYNLAALHLGRQLNMSRLAKNELDVSSVKMRDEMGYLRYAVKISPLGVSHV
ncbi:uncharacterized protein PG998_009033 [Apiospora kogelbergensis]|uniref:uncharacterized protein n=1 Tax=Apiospora kogelbergensis TaxID=1337665 RepID=UPI0031327A74